jgi:hypothetical protein
MLVEFCPAGLDEHSSADCRLQDKLRVKWVSAESFRIDVEYRWGQG